MMNPRAPALDIAVIRLGVDHASSLGRFFALLAADQRAASVFHPHPFTPEQAKLIAEYSGHDCYAGVLAGDDIVAYGMLRGWDEGYEIPSLGVAVASGHRGLGLGRLMMDYLHSVARLRGAPSIMLKVYKNNEPAAQLYRQMGYEMTDLNEREWRGTFQFRASSKGAVVAEHD
jgi:ribosomal protein S18 acetylase RimI-like enzyme